jgi:hypothetical protein
MTPDSDLVAWRARRLARAGFSPRRAHELARAPGVDLHALLKLIDRGCPPALAARITAPVDADQDSSPVTSATSESCSSRQAGQPFR